jgi:hypothetical protein
MEWLHYEAPKLTPAQKAHAYDQFAAEFDGLPRGLEPYPGWALTMARLCRRAGGRLRGEAVVEWVGLEVPDHIAG